MPELGVLKRVDLRTVWPKEAYDFTPWLAQHLSSLTEVLGMELELQGQEMPVGSFSSDIIARDLGRDRTVIIENQLEPTDHDHLGKLLTYAAGYDATTVVWIAKEIREEHRQALDWLNQRTDRDTEFYALVVELLQIDDSRPAYNFRVVVSPNEWRKEKVASAPGTAVSERGEAYRAFFQALIDELREKHQFTRARAGQPQNWYTFSSGILGVSYGLSFAMRGKVRAEVYLDLPNAEENKKLFDALTQSKEQLESAFGEQLEWERLHDRRASRIAIYRPGTIEDPPQALEEIRRWGIDRLLRFKQVFGPRLAELQQVKPAVPR